MEFEYLFRDDAWFVREGYSTKSPWQSLKEAVAALPTE